MIVKCEQSIAHIEAGEYLRCIEVKAAAHNYDPGYYVKRHGEPPREALRVSAADFPNHFRVLAS